MLFFYLIAYLVDFLGVYLSSLASTDPIQDDSLVNLLINYVFYYFTKSLYIYLALVFTQKYLFGGKRIVLKSTLHILLAFLLSFYTSFVQLLISKHIMGSAIEVTFESVYIRGLNGLSFNFFVYFSMVAILYAYNYLQKEKENEIQQMHLTNQLFDSKIQALQSQLQPHFLFNALNDISSLMEEDITKSQDAIADLSDLLRDTLNLTDSKFIPLEKELELLKKYLQLEKIRFDDKLQFEINVAPELLPTQVPPLLLQPILENAIKHGFSLHHDVLIITIDITGSQENIHLTISNNGQPLPDTEPVMGIGISNILSRMDSLYNGNFTFEMRNTVDEDGRQKVVTEMQLPVIFT